MKPINEYIVETNKKEHDELIDVMSKFYDDDAPKVGIFWYDIKILYKFGIVVSLCLKSSNRDK